jgi:hypothetical protein
VDDFEVSNMVSNWAECSLFLPKSSGLHPRYCPVADFKIIPTKVSCLDFSIDASGSEPLRGQSTGRSTIHTQKLLAETVGKGELL